MGVGVMSFVKVSSAASPDKAGASQPCFSSLAC